MQPTPHAERIDPSVQEELQNCDRQIARLVVQLRRDNEVITRLVEDRHRRRRELLAARERKLRALRDVEEDEQD